jgi:hypothetical protein
MQRRQVSAEPHDNKLDEDWDGSECDELNGDENSVHEAGARASTSVDEAPVIDLKKKTRKDHRSRVTGFTPTGRKARQAAQHVERDEAAATNPQEKTNNQSQTYLDILRRAPGGLTGRWIPQEQSVPEGCWSLPGGREL